MLGVFLNIFLFSYSGCHIRERKSDIKSPEKEECNQLLPANDLDKIHMETNKEGTSMHYEIPYGSL